MQRGNSAYGLDKELAVKAMAKYDSSAEDEAREWIETITGRSIGPDFGLGLKDGVILCELANSVDPNSRIKISTSSMPFRQMENVTAFIRACRAIGVMEFDLFETVDLYEQKDLGVVVRCIHALGRTLQKNPSYKGPILGVKEATKNERTFTEAQLAEARHATSLLNMGSQAFMDRPNIDVTSSVTFGYDSTTDLPPPSATSFISTSSTTNAIPSILTKNAQGAFASSSPEKPFFRRPSSYGSPTKPIETPSTQPAPSYSSPATTSEAPSYKKSTSFSSPAQPTTTKPSTLYGSPAKTIEATSSKSSVAARWMAATQSSPADKKEESSETSSESEPTTPSSEPIGDTTAPPVQPAVEPAKVVSTYDSAAESQVVQWIEAITHRKVADFGPNLQSGKLLCIFINTLLAISAADEAPIRIESSSMAFKQLQNIKNFLSSCRAIGVADADCFEPTDLYELKNLGAVVSCLVALNQAIVKKYPEYPGPVLTQQEKSTVATPSVAPHTYTSMLRHTSSRGLPTRTNWQ